MNHLLGNNSINVNLTPKEGATPLFNACANGHVESVALLLKRSDTDVNYISSNHGGITCLGVACWKGFFRIVSMLLAHGNIDVDKGRATPLYIAHECGHAAVVDLLINNVTYRVSHIQSKQ